jgi:hypothetical protein
MTAVERESDLGSGQESLVTPTRGESRPVELIGSLFFSTAGCVLGSAAVLLPHGAGRVLLILAAAFWVVALILVWSDYWETRRDQLLHSRPARSRIAASSNLRTRSQASTWSSV